MMWPLAMAAALLVSGSNTAPTYLACSLDSGSDKFDLNITADEQNQRGTVEIPSTGALDRGPAVFSAKSVRIPVAMSGGMTLDYEVDRITLALTRKLSISDNVTHGQCKVDKVAKRAF